jgi:hypothetical protein
MLTNSRCLAVNVVAGGSMGYVRYKLSNESHDMLKKVSRRLGMKESELSRVALIEYMRSLGILSERVKKRRMSLKI